MVIDTYIQFDSGKRITFADANLHTLIFGTTGSGKTSGPVMYSLNQCISAGFGGFVVDIKNNMTEKIMELAKNHGRTADVIELGSEHSAMPINILEGKNRHGIQDFLYSLMAKMIATEDVNIYWHKEGLIITTDMAEILLYFSKLDKRLTPSIGALAQYINSCNDCSKLFEEFKELKHELTDEKKPIAKIDHFIQSMEGNAYHAIKKKTSSMDDFDKYTTWALSAIRNALTSFIQTPGLLRNFSCASNEIFNFQTAIEQKKIVILRFNPATGPMGNAIARYLTEEYYKAVYATGLELAQGEYIFVTLDEFQQFADLTDARFSDASFAAQAREFNCLFTASTQSMSALVTPTNNRLRVEQFVANCNNRIIFYSDDVLLQEMVQRYNPKVRLTAFQDTVFTINYDNSKRQHNHSLESLQCAHDKMKELLKNVKKNNKLNLDDTDEPECISKHLSWIHEAMKTKYKTKMTTIKVPRKKAKTQKDTGESEKMPWELSDN